MDDKIANVPFEEDELQEQRKQNNDNNFEPIEQKRYCKKCKKWLPISHFGVYGGGLRRICKACQNNIKNPSESLLILLVVNLLKNLDVEDIKASSHIPK